MWAFFECLLDSSMFSPHGICLLWEPELIWLHVGSDALIAMAYFSIPIALAILVSKRRDLKFGWVYWAFGVFILACGFTHVLSIYTLWVPIYGIEGLVKAATAMASVFTAGMLWPLLPELLTITSPFELRRVRAALEEEEMKGRGAERMLAQFQETQRALRESMARLTAVVETAVDGFILIDSRGRILLFNPACERLFGYRADEVFQENVKLLMPRTYSLHHDDYLRNFLQSGERKIIGIGREVVGRRKDGSTFPMDLSVGEARQDGESIFVGIIRDLSSRKRTEAELEQARAELLRVARVTTLGELTAAIAHEVNQPLTGLVSSGNACLRWLAGDVPNLMAARESVERMISGGSRAGEVIRRIRALVGKAPPLRDRFNINDAITEVIALIRGEIQRDRISLRTKLSTDVPLVLGDRIQLQQVILNLILNAMEAMSDVSPQPRELS